MVSAVQFLSKEMQKLNYVFQATVAVGLDKIYHLWNEDANGSDESKNSETKKVEKTRKEPGRDGGISKIIEEKKDGKTISVTHKVTNKGQTIHQHQTHIGKHGSTRRFPENWIENKTIGNN